MRVHDGGDGRRARGRRPELRRGHDRRRGLRVRPSAAARLLPQRRSRRRYRSEPGDSLDELRVLLERHARYTGSARATALLDAWERESRLFVHVAPSTETTTVDTDAELSRRGRREVAAVGPLYTHSPMSLTDSTWTPSSWRSRAAAQQPDWPDPDALAAVRDRLQGSPPLVFAGEARALLVALGEVCEGTRVPAPGRRLRRVVPRRLGAGDSRAPEGVAADVRRPHIRGDAPGREGGEDRWAVREVSGRRRPRSPMAPSCCRSAVTSSTPTSPRPRRAYPTRSGSCRLLPVRLDAEPPARVHEGGFALDLTHVHNWNREFVASSPSGRRYEALRRRDRARAAVHAGDRSDLGSERTIHEVDA